MMRSTRWARLATTLTVAVAATAVVSVASPASADWGAMHEPITGNVISNFNRCDNGSTHDGIDVTAPIGRNVYSMYRGTVRFTGSYSGYGTTVDMSHDQQTYWTRYAHLSRIVVAQGTFVERGVKIAESGQSGNAEGPHLHFEVLRGGQWGTPVNMDSAYPCGKDVVARERIPFGFEGLPA